MGLFQFHLEDPWHVGDQRDLGGDSGRGLEEDVVAVDVDLGVHVAEDPNRHLIPNGNRHPARAFDHAGHDGDVDRLGGGGGLGDG